MNDFLPSEMDNTPVITTKLISLFALAFAMQYVLYFYIPDSVLANRVYHDFIVIPVVHVINFIFPAEHAYGLSNSIRSDKVDLEILRGCDGSGLLFLLEAAIIAFPASIKRKCSGMAIGLIFVYVLNCVRIAVLFYVATFQPSMFEAIHSFYIPTLLIALAGIFFFMWSMVPSNETSQPN